MRQDHGIDTSTDRTPNVMDRYDETKDANTTGATTDQLTDIPIAGVDDAATTDQGVGNA